jgi:hypothetical protein
MAPEGEYYTIIDEKFCVELKFRRDRNCADLKIFIKQSQVVVLLWQFNYQSLYLIQILDGLLQDLPAKFSSAIQLNSLNIQNEFGIFSLASTLAGINIAAKNPNVSPVYLSIFDLKLKIEEIVRLLLSRRLADAIRKAEECTDQFMPVKMACHIFLHFIFGELHALRYSKAHSSASQEVWKRSFLVTPCLNLLATFSGSLRIGHFLPHTVGLLQDLTTKFSSAIQLNSLNS